MDMEISLVRSNSNRHRRKCFTHGPKKDRGFFRKIVFCGDFSILSDDNIEYM